ncbi:hypothetical protein TYRP_016374 [Tyrophagus putrescentiae]|nr:hypothetical protein TYRP_016374 [Tyrophagus putrescentiae]
MDWTTVFEAAIEGWALRGVELPPVSEAATVVVVAFLGCCADEGGVKKAHNFDTLPLSHASSAATFVASIDVDGQLSSGALLFHGGVHTGRLPTGQLSRKLPQKVGVALVEQLRVLQLAVGICNTATARHSSSTRWPSRENDGRFISSNAAQFGAELSGAVVIICIHQHLFVHLKVLLLFRLLNNEHLLCFAAESEHLSVLLGVSQCIQADDHADVRLAALKEALQQLTSLMVKTEWDRLEVRFSWVAAVCRFASPCRKSRIACLAVFACTCRAP